MKYRPKPTVDRPATQKELDCIDKTEQMLSEEKKLPPASQMIRNLATDHWRSLKAFIKGKQVIVPQEIAEERWDIFKIHLEKRGRNIEKFEEHKKILVAATKDYTGAEIEKAIKDGIAASFYEGKNDLAGKMLLHAIAETNQSQK